MNRPLVNIAFLILTIASSLVLAEAGMRIIAPQNLSGSWRTASPTGLLVNRSGGSAQHQFDDRIVHYKFYAPHLRDSELKPDNRTVLVLGDSFTFGWLLSKTHTFVHKLQVLSECEFGGRAFNFINAASGGWGTADYVAYVEEFGSIIHPEVILVFLNTDDVGRSLRSPLYSLTDSDSLLVRRNRIKPGTLKKLTELIPFYNWSLEHLHSLQLLRKAYLTLVSGQARARNEDGRNPLDLVPHSDDSDALRIREAVDLTKALFLRLKRWADDNGSELYVTTTGWHRPPYDQGPPEPTRAFMVIAERFFEQAGIPYRDVSHHVRQARIRGPGSFIIANDGHPNEAGSELIARSVWPFIREKLHEFRVRRPQQTGAKAAVVRENARRTTKPELAVNGLAKDRYSARTEPLAITADWSRGNACSDRAWLTTRPVGAYRPGGGE